MIKGFLIKLKKMSSPNKKFGLKRSNELRDAALLTNDEMIDIQMTPNSDNIEFPKKDLNECDESEKLNKDISIKNNKEEISI